MGATIEHLYQCPLPHLDSKHEQQGTTGRSDGRHGHLPVQDHNDHPEDTWNADVGSVGIHGELDIWRDEAKVALTQRALRRNCRLALLHGKPWGT